MQREIGAEATDRVFQDQDDGTWRKSNDPATKFAIPSEHYFGKLPQKSNECGFMY